MDFNQLVAEYNTLKTRVDELSVRVTDINGKLDSKTDSVLNKVAKSSVSWLFVLVYTFGVFTLGAMLF